MRFLAGLFLTLAGGGFLTAQQPAATSTAAATPATSQTSSQAQPNPTPAVTSSDAAAKPVAGQKVAPPAASPQSPQPSTPASPPTLPKVSKREAAEAKRQFQAGVKLQKKGELDEALAKFSSAAELNPTSYLYIRAREFTRQELAKEALQRGNKAMLDDNDVVAMAEFQRALQYDPSDDYALQRLRDATPAEAQPAQQVSVAEQSTPIELRPNTQRHDFHFRGDSRALITELAHAYGITAQFDDTFKERRVHFDIDNVDCATALNAADDVTNSFWIALSPTQVYFLADTVENRRQFERFGLETFRLADLTDQELTEMTNSLRVLLNLRFISLDKTQSTITIRAELPLLQAAEHLINSLTTGRPQVLLDVRVYAVSSSFARALGVGLPTQFTSFYISESLIAGLSQSSQNLVNQLISSGGINQGNSQAVSALLAQLQNSSTSSLLTTPFAIFGGGLTTFGLNGGTQGVTGNFSLNQSDIRNLEHVQLRASHNDPAVLKIGERYPIVNATFAPIYNSSAIAGVLGNQSYIAPVPSVNFEDLGVNLKATPWIHNEQDITMKLELQIRSLGATTNNGIPIINNREYTGTITVKDGESSVVTGMVDVDDSNSISGYPFVGELPGVGYAATVHNKNIMQDELLVVITPHILRMPEQPSFAVELPQSH